MAQRHQPDPEETDDLPRGAEVEVKVSIHPEERTIQVRTHGRVVHSEYHERDGRTYYHVVLHGRRKVMLVPADTCQVVLDIERTADA